MLAYILWLGGYPKNQTPYLTATYFLWVNLMVIDMKYPKDLSGLKFNKLTVVSKSDKISKNHQIYWNCVCECGTKKVIRRDHLTRLTIKSCGCIGHHAPQTRPRHYHGKANTPEYTAWQDMKARCNNPFFVHYHGKGITVCDRWKNSFEDFLADVGKKPSKTHSIGRKDNDGNYCPSNAGWETVYQQSNNTSRNRRFEFNGETLNIQQWATKTGMKHKTLSGRLDRGWTIEQALTIPVGCGHLKYRLPK